MATIVCFATNGAAFPAGTLDTNFNVGSAVYGVDAIGLQTDGKVIVGGTFGYYNYVWRQGIARANSDASLDLSFDAGNVAGNGNGVRAIHVYSDGRILIAGGFSGAGRNYIACLNTNGTLDTTFDPASGPNGDIACLAVQPDGKIIIGGNFTTVAGQSHARLARLNTDGTLDPNFAAFADNDVRAVVLQPDGKIIVGGWFSHLNGVSPPYLARLNSDGTLDPSFVGNVNMPVECLGLQPDGRILLGGSFSFSVGAPIARVMPNGSWDPGFSVQAGSWVWAIRLQNDGRILIGGTFTTVNGASRPYLARLYSDGSTDLSFSAATDNLVDAIAIQPDGRFVISGGFGSVEGISAGGLARLYGDDLAATPVLQFNGSAFKTYQSETNIFIPVFRSGNTNVALTVQYLTADLEAQAGVDYLATAGTLNFAAGETAKSINVPLLNDGEVENFERLRIMLTNAVGGVLGSTTNATVTVLGVNSIVQIASPDVVTNELAGGLRVTLTRVVTNLASTVLCQTVNGTALAGVNFSNLVQTVTFSPGQATNTINLTLLDNALPGPDTSFSVQISDPINAQIGARSNLSVTIRDNDAAGHPAFGLNGSVNAVTATADGGAILGGNFISINGTATARLSKVLPDGLVESGFTIGTGLDGAVSAVLVQTNGKIVCGGNFTTYSGTSRMRMVRIQADGTMDGSFDPGIGPNAAVRALVSSPDGGCFAGGAFTSYGGAARKGIVKINADGSINTNFIPQIPAASTSFSVLCLALQTDGKLLVGSDNPFGANTNITLRFNPDGSRDVTFTNRISAFFVTGRINSMVTLPDGKILAGGSFSGGGIARLNTNGSLDTTFTVAGGVSSGTINKLLVLTNGQIMAVGSFSTYAGTSRNNITRINSNGSIDPTFGAGLGADSAIMDIAPLAGNRFAIGGAFRKFAGFPRYYFAILDFSGALITRVEFESFTGSSDLIFGMAIEPEVPVQLLTSSNLIDWVLVYTNTFQQRFAPLSLPRTGGMNQFFRILQTR